MVHMSMDKIRTLETLSANTTKQALMYFKNVLLDFPQLSFPFNSCFRKRKGT